MRIEKRREILLLRQFYKEIVRKMVRDGSPTAIQEDVQFQLQGDDQWQAFISLLSADKPEHAVRPQ